MKNAVVSRHVNFETERTVIGALLAADGPVLRATAGDLIDRAGLQVADFADPLNRTWFECIQRLVEISRAVTPETVWQNSKGYPGVPQDGHLKLGALQRENVTDRPALSTLADGLRRLTKLRAIEAFHRKQLEEIDSAAADPTLLASELDNFSQGFAGTSDEFDTGVSDLIEITTNWSAARDPNRPRKPYLPTGIELLDEQIMGWEENLNVVGGPPSAGKSALLTAAIWNELRAGHRIALFGLEDGTKWLSKRLISRAAGIPVKWVEKEGMHPQQEEASQEAMGSMAETTHPNLLTWKHGGLTSSRLLQLCKKAIAKHRVRGIYVDHGLEIQHEGLRKNDDLRTRIQHTFAQLRDLAFTKHVPIVVVVHFNRDQGKREGLPPTMHDFAECAGIERMARLAIGLWEVEADGAEFVRCSILKQTEGAKNVHLKLRRELAHAIIANTGGHVLDLKAERAAQQAQRRIKPPPPRRIGDPRDDA